MPFELAECQRVIGYHFANPKLLEVALTHSSLRTPDRECNERLEFLGDSVLGLVITEELYRLLPDQAEGELTRLKSAVVSRGSLYRASQRLGLARFAEFARGVGRREELPVSVTANLVEAVIGAIYLDAGFFPAREFVLRHLGEELEATLSDRGAKNYKSLLQHEVQEALRLTPTYRTLEEGGPDHKKEFVVAAIIRGQEWGRGEASTKKEAEQEAAKGALEAFQRRGRGRRRRRGERDDELKGPRDVAEHVDDVLSGEAFGEPGPFSDLGPEAEADLPPPELDAPAAPERAPTAAGWDAAAAPPPAPEAAPAQAPPSAAPEPAPAPARASRTREPGRESQRQAQREPAAGAARPERARSPEPRSRPAARAATPPAPRAPASADGFAAGIGDLPAPAPQVPPTPPAPPVVADLGAVHARKKAPAPWTPPPPDAGFDSGL